MFIVCFIALPPVKFLLVNIIVYILICFTKLFLNFKPLEEQLGTQLQETLKLFLPTLKCLMIFLQW